MNKDRITQIIVDHPEMDYGQLKKQALEAGISMHEFEKAWEKYLDKNEKPVVLNWISRFSIELLILATLVLLDIAYWEVIFNLGPSHLVSIFSFLGLFFAFALSLEFAARFIGMPASLWKSFQLAIGLNVIFYITHLMSGIQSELMYFMAAIGVGISLLISLLMIARTYRIGWVRTIFFLILSAFFMTVVLQSTYGLRKFQKDYFDFQKPATVDSKPLEIDDVFRR